MRLRHKICNWLFGWDYVYWKNSADNGIARVRIDGEGNPFYVRYRITNVIDRLDKDYPFREVIWLTCKPEKYLK